jgi:alpha-beta hydrolase superfamily lysophospholipase
LISFDKTPFFYRRLSAHGHPKALLLVLHGMGEHGGRYRRFAEYLSGMGLECLLPDLRGFGQSGGYRGYVRRFSDYHEDIKALHGYIVRQRQGCPIFMIGHSFGGLLAASYRALHPRLPVAGLVLSSPLFGLSLPLPRWRRALASLLSVVYPRYDEPNRVMPENLTHDPAEIAIYKKDRLIHHRVTARLYAEMSRLMALKMTIAARLNDPVLILQAGEDRIVSKEDSIDFYHGLASRDKELEICEGFYHEILNETNREKIHSRIGVWISDRLT